MWDWLHLILIFFVCHNSGLCGNNGSARRARKLRIINMCVQKLCSIFGHLGMMIEYQLPAQGLKYFRNTLSGSESISTYPAGPQFFFNIDRNIGFMCLLIFDNNWYIARWLTRWGAEITS